MTQALETVIRLNELLPPSINSSFWYNTNHNIDSISLDICTSYARGEIHLWNDQESQRIYIEETNEYEPLEETILRELDNLIKELNNIKDNLRNQ